MKARTGALVASFLFGCSSGAHKADGGTASDAGSDAGTQVTCPAGTGMGVGHVIIIVQENHTFDTYFGGWCTAATGSNPTCTTGPVCCEAAPGMDPSGASPTSLDDNENNMYDPNHTQACEVGEIDNGKMDKFVTGTSCSDPRNFAYSPASVVGPYQTLAAQNAIADRYFQPIAGQSSSNDVYLAIAKELFIDNAYEPAAPGSQCQTLPTKTYTGQTTIADLLTSAGKSVAWYSGGWADMVDAGTSCPMPPLSTGCPIPTYPCVFDPGDVPFLYFSQFTASTSTLMRDYTQLSTDLAGGMLPDVSYVKAIGYESEHPAAGSISQGIAFVSAVIEAVAGSCYKDNTLILLTWDEGGGFYDHVAPPATSTVDNQPYGTRIPLLAIGPYALAGTVSHTQMEHSSIVKFLEWNYLGGKTGQLNARDAVVNNIGSLLDPTKTLVPVPAQ